MDNISQYVVYIKEISERYMFEMCRSISGTAYFLHWLRDTDTLQVKASVDGEYVDKSGEKFTYEVEGPVICETSIDNLSNIIDKYQLDRYEIEFQLESKLVLTTRLHPEYKQGLIEKIGIEKFNLHNDAWEGFEEALTSAVKSLIKKPRLEIVK